jgi:hypothetical protein
MRRTILLATLAVIMYGVTSCKDAEKDAYENLRNSKDLSSVNAYLAEFKDAPKEHLDSIKMLQSQLQGDSSMYVAIKSEKDVIARYQLEVSYINTYKSGIYVNQVKQKISVDGIAAEKAEKEQEIKLADQEEANEYAEYARFFKKFYFIEKDNDSDLITEYVFNQPNNEGKGIGECMGRKFHYTISLEDDEVYLKFDNKGYDLQFADAIVTTSSSGIYVSYSNGNDIFYEKVLR